MSNIVCNNSISFYFTSAKLGTYPSFPEKTDLVAECEKIYKAVFYPGHLSVVVDGEPQNSFPSKIQWIVKELKTRTAEGCFSGYRNLSVVYSLLSKILDRTASREIKGRAQYVLIALEKLIPELHLLNNQIVHFFSSEGKKERKTDSSRKYLEKFGELQHQPLELRCPLRPHVLPKTFSLPFFDVQPVAHLVDTVSSISFWTLHKIVIGIADERHILHTYFRELSQIAQLEGGLSLRVSGNIKWLRDVMIVSESEKIFIPRCLEWTDETGRILEKITHDFSSTRMNGVASRKASEKLLGSGLQGATEADFYFEGGNVLFAPNQKGRIVCLSGASNVLYSALNAHHFFSAPDKMRMLRKEMAREELFSKERLFFIQKRLEEGGVLSLFSSIEDKQFIAKLMIAACECVAKCMEDTLGHPILILGDIFDAQPEFHLDIFLMPAPNGTIFIQSHKLSSHVLKMLIKNYPLTTEEKNRAILYLHLAKERQKLDGDKLDAIVMQLKKADFKVVLVPGLFYEEVANHLFVFKPVVSFLNGIVGIGKQGTFCITNGSSHPVDRHLRDIYTCFLQENGVPNVYFTGRNLMRAGDGSTYNYRVADEGLQDWGGVHCRTQVIKKKCFEMIKDASRKIPPMDQIHLPIEKSLPLFFQEMIEMQTIANCKNKTLQQFIQAVALCRKDKTMLYILGCKDRIVDMQKKLQASHLTEEEKKIFETFEEAFNNLPIF